MLVFNGLDIGLLCHKRLAREAEFSGKWLKIDKTRNSNTVLEAIDRARSIKYDVT